MRLAIQESMLPGDTTLARVQHARDLGLAGVEFEAEGLSARVSEIVDALAQTGLEAAAVNMGTTTLLHPEFARREEAIVHLRQAMTNALDLGTVGVVFIPTQPDAPRLPDLHPYKSNIELEAELLVTQIRATLSDFAYALGAELYMLPVNRYESHLIRRLEHGDAILRRNDYHPHVRLAVDTFHLMMEEDDPLGALQAHAAHVRYVHLADHNRRLPGQGMTDFTTLLQILKEAQYTGWLTLACDRRTMTPELAQHLPASLGMLRQLL
ncbi:MAG: sugar phosphate isomerase/epimerase [Anaerolineae bacterium]